MGLIGAFLVVFQFEENRLGVVPFFVRKVGVGDPAVLLVTYGITTAGLVLNVRLHGLLALGLLPRDLFVGFVTRLELNSDLLLGGEVAFLQPRVCHDIGDREALVRVEVQHGRDQVFELLGEEAGGLAVLMRLPESGGAVSRQKLVVRILTCRAIERWMASVQDKEDDTECEKVYDLALVRLLSMDLGSHEAKRTYVGAVHTVAGAAFNGACESEIDDFDIVELVEKDVFALHISVSEALSVDVVNGLDELLSVVTHDGLIEGARVSNVVEKLATWHKLLNDVGNIDLLAILLLHDGVFVKLEVFDHVFVLEVLYRVDLVLQELESSLAEVGVVEAEDFQGELAAVLSRAKFDFGAEAGAKCFAEGVPCKSCCHLVLFVLVFYF